LHGRTARGLVETARAQVAALIAAQHREIIWTSGATESNNLAITGTARAYQDKGRHIVTSKTEHKAVLDTCRQLEKEGFEVNYLTPGNDGLIPPQQVADALRDDTILVSIMHVNNEIGVVQDIEAIGEICCREQVLFHVDAAQSAGKMPIDVTALHVSMMSFSGHKIYGPKGIGALFVCHKPYCHLEPIIHGGGQEGGLRSGTLATHQIVGMGDAFALARAEFDSDHQRIFALRERLWQGIGGLGGVMLNGHPEQRVAGILNVSIEGIEGESLLFALRNLAVSSGSACTSAAAEPSYVLRAIGRNDQQAQSSIRFSIGRFTSEAEIDYAIMEVCDQVQRLRSISSAGNSDTADDVRNHSAS
jgi:cysteine desulfurase